MILNFKFCKPLYQTNSRGLFKKEEKRKKETLVSNNLTIKIKPEFLEIFKSSQAILTILEKSYFLARDPKVSKVQRRINELKAKKKNITGENSDFK